jgi:hypothetical protein
MDIDCGKIRPQKANLSDFAGLMALFEKPFKSYRVKLLNVGLSGCALSTDVGEVRIVGEHGRKPMGVVSVPSTHPSVVNDSLDCGFIGGMSGALGLLRATQE